MEKRSLAALILGAAGAVATLIPIAAPFAFGFLSLIGGGGFRFDYLMPAELSPLAAFGCGLLLAASFVARKRRAAMVGGAAAAGLFFGATILAGRLTGLASGAHEADGWRMGLVIACLWLYALSLGFMGVAGCLLIRDLRGRGKAASRATGSGEGN